MEIEVFCRLCSEIFTPLPSQVPYIEGCARGGITELKVQCTACGKYTPCNPVTVMSRGDQKAEAAGSTKEEVGFKCPVARCYGDLSFIDDGDEKPFWGCGECGSVWYDKKNLMSEITAIVERYGYRRRCYAKARGGWRAASPSRHPKDYQDLVLNEDEDARNSFVRG